MKICLLTTSFPRHKSDDAGIFISRLVSALSEQSVSGTVLAPYSKGAEQVEAFSSEWTVERVKYGVFTEGRLAYGSGIMPNLRANPYLLMQIPSLLLCLVARATAISKKSDLIHANWIASALPAMVASLISKRPLIVTIRGVDLRLLGLPIIGAVLRSLLARSSAITTISNDFQDKLQSYFPRKQIHLVPNGVSRNYPDESQLRLTQEKYSLTDINYSVFAGRVIRLKRVELLVSLLSKLKDCNHYLVICGSLADSPYVNNLREQVSHHGLSSRVLFLGPVKPDDLGIILAGARFYWSASEYEGRPNSVLEALAHCVPAILSNIAAHNALIKSNQNGLLFEVSGLDLTAREIDSLLEDVSKHRNMGKKAQESVANVSWESCASGYIELYKQILK